MQSDSSNGQAPIAWCATVRDSSSFWYGADCVGWGVLVALGGFGGDQDESALGEDFESEAAASGGPLIMLFCQDGSDEPADRGPVGEKIPTPSGRTQVVVTFDGGCRVPVALSLGRRHPVVMIMSSPVSGRMSACG